MSNIINVTFKGSSFKVPELTTVADVILNGKKDYSILGAFVNNEIKHMNFKLTEDSNISEIRIDTTEGFGIYYRTITAIFAMASLTLFPNNRAKIEHFLGSALYATFEGGKAISYDDLIKIESAMRDIISADMPITRERLDKSAMYELFERTGDIEKVKLLKTSGITKNHVTKIGDFYDMYEGVLASSTGYISDFSLRYYYPGLLIVLPTKNNQYNCSNYMEHPKLAKVFTQSTRWANILDLSYIGSLNEKILEGENSSIIRISESLHEKRISEIADKIVSDDDIRIVMIAGPSSSGKTTFSKRLYTALRVHGRKPCVISTDDYFVDREKTPLDENGEYDFETIEAIDLPLFEKDMMALMEGTPISKREFDFKDGRGKVSKDTWDNPNKDLIIIEGIHSLNPKLLSGIPDKCKFRIYISALTQLNMDAHNRISTTDTRLLRRMIRDYNYRGYSPEDTFGRWESVGAGEKRNIFPYQEMSDVMFDSSLVYEMAVLKKHAIPMLKTVTKNSKHYSTAIRLIRFLSYFVDIDEENEIPMNSILREFLPKERGDK